jgi:hypothetical protein
VAVEKLQRHKSAGTDYIPLEFIQAWRATVWSEISKLINSICNKEGVNYCTYLW